MPRGIQGSSRGTGAIRHIRLFETVMAVTGFTLFGMRDWAPYVMNSLLALIYFLTADRLLRGVATVQKILCFVFLAYVPFVGMAVHEFRPDGAAALFTAAGVCTLLAKPFVQARRRRKVIAGVWFGVAMPTKPTVFPQTLALGFGAIALATLCDWAIARRRPKLKATAKAWAAVLVPFILIPLPHYLYNGPRILFYMHDVLFGYYRETYQFKGTPADHLLYYLSGRGGRIMLGQYVWILPAVILFSATGLAVMGRRRDWMRGAAMVIVAAQPAGGSQPSTRPSRNSSDWGSTTSWRLRGCSYSAACWSPSASGLAGSAAPVA